MKKDKEQSSLVYILADYRQLVLQYRTKYSEQIKKATFWKTTALWSLFLLFCLGLWLFSSVVETKINLLETKNNTSMLNRRLENSSLKLERTEQELVAAKEELNKKNEAISQLERRVTSASKRLVESLLRGQ